MIMRALGLGCLLLLCVAAAPAVSPARTADRAQTAFELSGLRTGMNLEQVRQVFRSTPGTAKVDETNTPAGAPIAIRAEIGGKSLAAFFSSPAKGSKVDRIVASEDLNGRAAAAVLAGWAERFGKPAAVYYSDNKRSLSAGWGLRPGGAGALANVGANPHRLLGEVNAPGDTVSLTFLDDSVAD